MSTADTSTESLNFAGEIVLRKIELLSSANFKLDIRDQILSIEVYEDIFSPFITMAVTLRESLDFINVLPIRGEEIITIELATPTFNKPNTRISGKFYVYKLADRELITDRNSVYTLYCVSYEALTDLNVKLSKANKGNIAEIAASLLGKDGLNTEKNINIEPTQNTTKYISNFWSPIKNLNYIAATAINKNDNPTYLFFENREGFNFVSLDLLYDLPVYQTFTDSSYVRDTLPDGKSIRNIQKEYQQIIEIKVRTNFDILKNINAGTYASRIYSYDMLRKKYYVKDYVAYDEFGEINHLNDFSINSDQLPTKPVNFIYNNVRHFSVFNGFNDVSNTETMQARASAIQLLKSNMIEIRVNGRTDYTVGQKVYIEVPKPAPINENDTADLNNATGMIDSMLSGNYLITAINNIINRENHTAILELCKDSSVE